MSRGLKIYLVLLALLGLATIALGAPDISAIVTLLTLGLGFFVTVAAVNLTLYAVLALPFVIGLSLKRRPPH